VPSRWQAPAGHPCIGRATTGCEMPRRATLDWTQSRLRCGAQPRVLHISPAVMGDRCALRADARLDAAAVPALLGAPAAILRRLSTAERCGRLAALAGRKVIASLYVGVGQDSVVHVPAVRLLDAEAVPKSRSCPTATRVGA